MRRSILLGHRIRACRLKGYSFFQMSETKPERGIASEGKSFDPAELPEAQPEAVSQPRPAPAPGLPISEEEYKRMKEAAKEVPRARVRKNGEKRALGKKRKGNSPQ